MLLLQIGSLQQQSSDAGPDMRPFWSVAYEHPAAKIYDTAVEHTKHQVAVE